MVMYWSNTNWASLLTDLCVIQLWQPAGSNPSALWYTLTLSCSSLFSHLYQQLTCCGGMPSKLPALYTCTQTHTVNYRVCTNTKQNYTVAPSSSWVSLLQSVWYLQYEVENEGTFIQWAVAVPSSTASDVRQSMRELASYQGLPNMLCQGATFAKVTWKCHPWLVRLELISIKWVKMWNNLHRYNSSLSPDCLFVVLLYVYCNYGWCCTLESHWVTHLCASGSYCKYITQTVWFLVSLWLQLHFHKMTWENLPVIKQTILCQIKSINLSFYYLFSYIKNQYDSIYFQYE